MPLLTTTTALATAALAMTALPGTALEAPDGQARGLATTARGGPPTCDAPAAPTFEQEYIDTSRAGGEPYVVTHPDGTLLWGSHAGTTHFFGPAAPDSDTAAFLEKYEGQTYQYRSADGGDSWQFSPRTPINAEADSGLPNSGFSDPEFAIDAAGNVFISEINLANIAVSKSTDSGETYRLQNLVPITMTDRQWMDADEEDVLWFVGNTFGGGSTAAGEPITGSLSNRLYKSTDGGQTFSEGQAVLPGQRSSEIRLDKNDGALYQLHYADQRLEMLVMADAREQTPPDVTFERHTIAEGVDRGSSIGPTFDVDRSGNLYAVWDDTGGGDHEAGIYYSYSTDQGRSWVDPIRLDDGPATDTWPWLAVGDTGHVSVTWLQHEDEATQGDSLENQNPGKSHPSEFADGDWHVMSAVTTTGLGCAGQSGRPGPQPPGFTVSQASTEPVHEGTICNGGTFCQAEVVDRRLGDYFSNTITEDGKVIIAVSDTRQGGAVALPLQLRQTAGPNLGDGTRPAPDDE